MIKRIEKDEVSEAAIEFELKRLVQFYSQHMTEAQLSAKMDVLREKARQQAIGVRHLIHEAWRRKVPVPDSEIDESIKDLTTKIGGKQAFQDMLKKQNITEELLRESLRDSKRVEKLIQEITADIEEPAPAEIKEYYDAHKQDYTKPDRRRAQHILVKPKSDKPADIKKTRATLEGIRAQHASGASFSELAAAYSECPSGRHAGGSIGWVSRGMLAPAMDGAIFSTEIGDVSEIVESALGLHLVLPNDSEEGGTASLEESSDIIRDLLLHNRRGKVIAEYVEKLKLKK